MTADPILCPAVTYRATRESPEESCENEVDDYGQLCADHEEDDRADELYDAYLDDQYEKRTSPDYYPDED